MRRNHHHWPGMWLGLGLATVGGGLLAREFGLLPAEVRLVDFWPLVLLFAGISSLLRARGFLGALFALAFVALGGLLLAGNLGLVHFPAARLWPGLLVLLGIAFLIGGAQSSRRRPPPTDSFGGASGGRNLATGERFDKQVTFAGLELKIESQAWRGGELGVTAGGVELDLRYARLAPEGALLDVRILMGGVDIRVPDTWQVKNDVTPLLGGADDSTRSTQGSTDAPLLRVVGSVTLGGISIHN
jgi:hypothetical protein